jgi:hypothetical protein
MCAVADFNAAALDKTGAAEAEPAIDSSNAPAKPMVIVRWIKLDLLMIISLFGHSLDPRPSLAHSLVASG